MTIRPLRRRASRSTLAALALLAACGGGGGGSAGSDGGAQWTTLLARHWAGLAPSADGFFCTQLQAARDLDLVALRPIAAAAGVFRLTVAVTDARLGPDGAADFDCTGDTWASAQRLLYVAGPGTGELTLPAGTALHVAAGKWLTLIVSAGNASDGALSGDAGVEARLAAAQARSVELILAGTTRIALPASASGTAAGGCTAPQDLEALALVPMMNRLGVRQVAQQGARTLLDAVYDPSAQAVHPLAPAAAVHAGDALLVTCSYVNAGSAAVGFGGGSADEVCFTGMYVVPGAGGLGPFDCVER